MKQFASKRYCLPLILMLIFSMFKGYSEHNPIKNVKDNNEKGQFYMQEPGHARILEYIPGDHVTLRCKGRSDVCWRIWDVYDPTTGETNWRFGIELDGGSLVWNIGGGIIPNNEGNDPEGNPMWRMDVLELISGDPGL